MNKKLIIINIVELLIIIGLSSLLIYFNISKENVETIKIETIRENKEEHYKKMLNKLSSYYKIYFRVKDNKYENTKVRVNLSQLEKFGFPVDEFVSYEGNELCDLEETYATKVQKDQTISMKIYYKCGDDYNYEN